MFYDQEHVDRMYAEIERLNTNYELLSDDYKQLQGDNERLRGLSDITRLDVMWQELVKERYAAEENAKILAIEVQRLREAMEVRERDHREKTAEIARLRSGARCPHCDELRLDLGDARREIERLRAENSQWQSACAGYTEALAAQDKRVIELIEELARIHDQIAKHNISVREAIRRGEAFEWKTLTLDS